jgi:hypothetical protein
LESFVASPKYDPRREDVLGKFQLHEFLSSLTREERQAWHEAEWERTQQLKKQRRRKSREFLWPGDGHQYFSINELARLRGTRPSSARQWAKSRPSLCIWRSIKGGLPRLYCRHEPNAPPEKGFPESIDLDGLVYYGMGALARRRGVTIDAAWLWAKAHPELTILHRGRKYSRDEGYRAPTAPPVIHIDGVEHVSLPELARRHSCNKSAAASWAKRHPQLVTMRDGHIFVRDEGYEQKNIPPIHWEGRTPYFSMPELARRRGGKTSAAYQWAKKRPHLAKKIDGYWYARDEEWEPRDPRETPNRVPVEPPIPPWIQGQQALRATRRHT